MKDLVYDKDTKSMLHPLSFVTCDEDIVFENDYYHGDIKWFLNNFQESQLLGYILNPDHDYYSSQLKTSVDGYTNATPCIFYKRVYTVLNRPDYIFKFDSEYAKDNPAYFIEQYPYVVMMRGCDDGHLGIAVKDKQDALTVLECINTFNLTNIQDINHLRTLQYHN